MAKKSQTRKNSRAARRNLDEPELDVGSTPEARATDAKERVLSQLAEKEKRDNPAPTINSLDDALTSISKGTRPGQSGKITKQTKKGKLNKKKQERAEMIKDMLAEKVTMAKQRHKTIKGYRQKEEAEQ